jgi:hypothetical protein
MCVQSEREHLKCYVGMTGYVNWDSIILDSEILAVLGIKWP